MRALAVGAVLVAILAGIVALVTPPTPRAKVDQCGEERWSVKTLTDTTKPGAGDIDVAHPVSAIGSEKVVTLQGKVSLSGVGFFDLIHGQGGVATNGIELHPILSFNASSCSRIASP